MSTREVRWIKVVGGIIASGLVTLSLSVVYYAITDHNAIADLQRKSNSIETMAVDIAVIKQKVFDLNEKFDQKGKDDRDL